VPFLLSGVLVLVGFWVRRRISESPQFAEIDTAAAMADQSSISPGEQSVTVSVRVVYAFG
ncbi:hypothetical protein AB0K48_51010, partial [Nonomuraea sp. NPDC055795]